MGTPLQGYTVPCTKLVFSMSDTLKKYYTPYMKRVFATSTGGRVHPTPRIQRGGNFKDLVTRSTIFADKSMFIKEIMEDDNTALLIAMPRRWGKSVNLDMLRRFLEIPVGNDGEVVDETRRKATDNYQIFRAEYAIQSDGSKDRLAVSKSRIIMQDPGNIFESGEVDALEVQGAFPVIYIDFKNCKSNNYKNVETLLRAELSRTFRSHSYLKDSSMLTQRQRELVDQYIEEKTDSPIIRGLQVLSDALYTHHNKKVWILVDEYDAVANVAYREFSEEDLKETIDLFSGIYETALKSNPHLEKGVLTGVQYIAQSGMLSGLNHLIRYDFTAPKYAQHYGLDREEVDRFFNHFGVPTECQENARKWYNGYKAPKCHRSRSEQQSSKVIAKYNVWSIVSYLLDGRDNDDFNVFQSYWEKSGNIDFMNPLFKQTLVREAIEKLVNGESILLSGRKSYFSADDFKILKEMPGENQEITQYGLDVLLSYLFIGGYLTPDEEGGNYYRLPNKEITYEMQQRLISYYETIYTVDPEEMRKATNTLQQVMEIDDATRDGLPTLLQDLHSSFKSVIQSIRLVDDKNEAGVFTNEDVVHSMFTYIALQTQHTTMASELNTSRINTKKGERGRADLKLTKDKVGMILEMKCVEYKENGQYMQDALEQAKRYSSLLNTKDNIFMAINVVKQVPKPEERSIELLCEARLSADTRTIAIDTKGKQHVSFK